MIGIEIKPVFRVDDEGNIVAPSGNVIVDKTQLVAPGVFYANVDLLNRVYHYGMQAAVTGNLIERSNDRARAESMRKWLEADTPLPDPSSFIMQVAALATSLPIDEEADRKANAALACLAKGSKPRKLKLTPLDVGPQCEAQGKCECDDGCGACHGCGRWLGDEPERIKKER